MNEITFIGSIYNVSSNTIEVEISKDIPSSSLIINGKLYRLGQIGSLIKIKLGIITLFGIVESVTNSPLINATDNTNETGSRFLQVQLIGEKVGNNAFEKGIGTYPTITDEVHIVTEDDLKDIYGDFSKGLIPIGSHSSSDKLPIYIDIHNLVLRHSAVLGSTGSGKSNTVANTIKQILKYNNGSRIVLIDPHGEYSSAFKNDSITFKINDKNNPLQVPFWAMTFDELSLFLVGRPIGQERPEDKRLREEILKLKLENIDALKAGKVKKEYITADSPIPFDLRKLWYIFNREVNSTFSVAQKDNQNKTTEKLLEEGDYKKLKSAKFEPYSMSNIEPYKNKDEVMYQYEKKIFAVLKDSRFDFMFKPKDFYDATSPNDIDKLLRDWIEHDKKLSILDLSGVPFDLIDISVGLITRLLYDSMYWGREETYTGRNRPLLMIFEEAHSYLPKSENNSHHYGYAKKSVEKIFKEGRKFGIGAMVVTQRPSEISDTILAQVGTFFALRLTNNSDKNTVTSASPNNMSSLMELLPSLRVGEAIIVGEAIKIPSRVRINLVEPRPNSNDPDLATCWSQKFASNKDNYKKIICSLREQKK